MKISTLVVALGMGTMLYCCTSIPESEKEPLKNLSQYVDPFIGTGGHGHTYPGATVPFGMVQLSPDNGVAGWDWSSGYNYSENHIIGFSHTHLSGTGIGDMLDVLIMPTKESVRPDTSKQGADFIFGYRETFDHANELAEPGYYQVTLNESGTEVELTATERSGFHRYTFSGSDSATILLDLGWSVNRDESVDTQIEIIGDTAFSGHRFSTGWAKDQRLYFYGVFSRPYSEARLLEGGAFVNGAAKVRGKTTDAAFSYPSSDDPLLLKVGISSSSVEGARNNLYQENPGWDFDQVREEAGQIWEENLAKIRIETDNDDLRTVFYTAMYHNMLAPTLYSNVDGTYTGTDGKVRQTAGFDHYYTFSLWDTYRATKPMFTFLFPDRVNHFVKSMMQHYREYGLLPVWSLWGNETNTMIGYHAIPVIVDAFRKGLVDDVDAEELFEAVLASGYQDIRQTPLYREFGYIPADTLYNSVSKTLEYAYDDWCIAEMAAMLNRPQIEQEFRDRAQYYRNVFDQKTRLMRAKLANGSWKEPFDPYYTAYKNDYTEGNAWQYSWYVPHDVTGLMELMGGPDPFDRMLDSVFTLPPNLGENAAKDVTGLIGQYVHGNEPSHHIAYLYNYAGKPWKTQQLVRKIMKQMYSVQPDGLSGNEDCGQMSAWYLFSALGLYPVNPASGLYDLGSPLFRKASIDIGNEKKIHISCENFSPDHTYVEKVSWNDQVLEDHKIDHTDLMEGGTLTFFMTKEPKK